MNKDVIYIDVDDDVTAIIGKIKASKEKIVALVPPKRAGALQSAVNLRLLDRMAKTSKKHLVLITNNQALVALAAAAKIPVAKNLQTKPEVAEIAALAVDEGDDIIDGAELPVGEHVKAIPVKDGTRTEDAAKKEMRSEALDDLDIDGEDVAVGAAAATKGRKGVAKKGKNRPKIPNFDSFRKKLFFGIGGGVALIALLIWMFVFAPAATIIITASTTPVPINGSIQLGGTAATNYETGVVSSVSQEEKKDATVEFTATGTKNVGEKASGTITITNCDGPSFVLEPGSTFTSSGGKTFASTESVTVSALSGSASQCRSTGAGAGTGSVNVSAVESGDSYNIAATNYSINGVSGDIYARGSAMTGGTTKVAKVVTNEDVERAKGELLGQSTDQEKDALAAAFTSSEVAITSSFTVTRGDAVSTPGVDQEAPDGKAVLTIPTTYTMQAVPKSDLNTYLEASINAKIDTATQKIYSTGVDDATIGNYRLDGETMLATVNATGRVGPKINEDQIKEESAGKIYGEVQQTLEGQDGITAVDVQFSYFWVRTVPNNPDKITVEFQVENE